MAYAMPAETNVLRRRTLTLGLRSLQHEPHAVLMAQPAVAFCDIRSASASPVTIGRPSVSGISPPFVHGARQTAPLGAKRHATGGPGNYC